VEPRKKEEEEDFCDFWERARVTRNRGREIVIIDPSGEGRLVVACFMLMTS
jgi:hypothetical protein